MFYMYTIFQIDHLALNKPATQTGTFGGQTADRAVDGLYDTAHCAQQDNPTTDPARWSVDLGDSYRVKKITLVNTEDETGFLRYISKQRIHVITKS